VPRQAGYLERALHAPSCRATAPWSLGATLLQTLGVDALVHVLGEHEAHEPAHGVHLTRTMQLHRGQDKKA
jgi:hypothetical protein